MNSFYTLYEKKVRKQWLICLCSQIIFALVFLVADVFTKTNIPEISQTIYIISYVVTFLCLIPAYWIPYHCSYKKNGTKWLLFLSIMLPLTIFAQISQIYLAQSALWSVFDYFRFIGSAVLVFVYWIMCIKLYKINSQRKKCQPIAHA